MQFRPHVFRNRTLHVCLACGVVALASLVFAARCPSQEQRAAAIEQAADISLPEHASDVVAYVGESVILLGDLLPKVDAHLDGMLNKSSQAVPEDQIETVRKVLIRSLLKQTIQNKRMREAFLLEQVGTQKVKDRDEAIRRVTTEANKVFTEQRLPELIKVLGTEDPDEIHEKLKEQGTTLDALRRDFVDQMLASLYQRDKVDRDPNVSIAEIHQYYQANKSEFHHPARARWEQLTVLFEKFPNRDEARTAIWEMLQEARFGGSMQAVARTKSQEPFASDGGLHGWTSRGALASKPLDDAIFSAALPLNRISDVIEDENGLHVIRVLEREPAGFTNLSKVQDQIREEIRREKIAESQAIALREMQNRVPVWSVVPEDIPGARPLPSIADLPTQQKSR